MVVAVKPKTVDRGALFLIAAAAILGVFALIAGKWILVAAMVLLVFGQGLNLRGARKERAAGAPRQ